VKTNLSKINVHPNYWYPVLRESQLAKGQTLPVEFGGRRLVVYRDRDGELHAMENSCAHRRVALHTGEVKNCNLVCSYHGWEFAPDGRLASIPYWPSDKKLPNVGVKTYPIQVRGELIWIFPGDPAEAERVAIPDTSDLHNDEWFSFCLDNDFYNHYSIGIINGMDYYHFHLHRRFQPWSEIKLLNLESDENSVVGEYEIITTKGRAGRLFKAILGEGRKERVVETLRVSYFYPHHLAEVGDKLKVWVFFLPVSDRHVKAFITMYVKSSGIQRLWHKPFKRFFSPLILKRIQVQDAWIGLQEQEAWDLYPNDPRCETNPISVAVEKLLVAKWRESLIDDSKTNSELSYSTAAD
jgi:phenylpropionate dioxygenase-like ring-hydroxylating dioxygenase large terminal subunit